MKFALQSDTVPSVKLILHNMKETEFIACLENEMKIERPNAHNSITFW